MATCLSKRRRLPVFTMIIVVGMAMAVLVLVKFEQVFGPNKTAEKFVEVLGDDEKETAKTTKWPCSLISNRWSLMYNPSLFRGKSHFPLVSPHIQPNLSCEETLLNIIVLVNSAANSLRNRNLRNSIRQTWANTSTDHNADSQGNWRLFFSLGLSNNADFQRSNLQEAKDNNDIIIGNFSDTYRNIPIKTFMSHLWAFSKFDFKYILKTDDDVYVRVPKLSQWLVSRGNPQRFYGGYMNRNPIIFRNPNSPWYISFKQFNESRWPDFCHGAFQILSIDLLPAYLYYTQVHKPFHTDDAYMGVVARDLGVKVTDIAEFSASKIPKTDCEFWSAIAMGDNITPNVMFSIEETYKRLSLKENITCQI